MWRFWDSMIAEWCYCHRVGVLGRTVTAGEGILGVMACRGKNANET